MSILAEPRRKQRISIDPNNLQWRDDDNKKGKKMMEKMGWSDGNGLGRNKQGNVDAVKLKANYSGKGLGADKIASYDSTWIGHHDDFADLLAALNKNKPKSEETEEEKSQRMTKMSIELSSKSVKRRIHYQKFTRMKDTANYSAQDKSAVLGVGLKRTKEESDEDTKEKSDSDSGVTTGNTTVSQLSVGDYFAAKMAALKANSQACATVKQEKLAVKEEEPEDEEYRVGFNQIGFSYEDVKVEIKEELVEETEGDEKARRKREKKLRKQKERELAEAQVEEPEVDEEEAERLRRKEEKRQKKLAKRQMEEAQSDEPEELTEKQRRKMEKRQRKLEEAEEVEEPQKKKSKE